MKLFLSLLFVVGLLPLQAEEVPPVQAISEVLRQSNIAKLELKRATFDEAFGKIRAEWERQHPALDFPVSLAHYERDHPPLITMSLHEVPFIKALQYVGESSRRRLVKRSDLLTFEDFGLIIEPLYHQVPPGIRGLIE